MSEYQYYEFQAVDRPLTTDEMAALRKITSRATITPTRLQNEYQWGNFKGDPLDLMEHYFDGFVYVANWGTNQFMLRLPVGLLDLKALSPYAVEDCLDIRRRGDYLLIDFQSQDEEGEWWINDAGPESWMSSLLPLRDELSHGDLRCLYLGWLAALETGDVDEDETEPPVPPGLGKPSAALKALAVFLRLNPDLLEVAAGRSSPQPKRDPSSAEFAAWLRTVAEEDKEGWLLQFIAGNAHQLAAEIFQRYRREHPLAAIKPEQSEQSGQSEREGGRRTAGELIDAAGEYAANRKLRELEEQKRQKAARLDSLAGREEAIWQSVDTLIGEKKTDAYDEAVELLVDLRDLAQRDGHSGAFDERLRQLRGRTRRYWALQQRLDLAGFAKE